MKEKSEEAALELAGEGKFKHLRADIRPIMTCVGTPDEFKSYPGPIVAMRNADEAKKAHFIDYYATKTELDNNKFKNAGEQSYVISTIDKKNKFSTWFKDCTGLVVAGKDKETGDNISFLSHEDPQYFLSGEKNKNKFIIDLRQRLNELKERCVDGTIDARVFGGNYLDYDEYSKENYLESIKLLSSTVIESLRFEPIVITGPKIVRGAGVCDDIFYDNDNRRLYIMRPRVGDSTTEAFVLRDIEEQEKKWL